jgi:hypothetical protein
MLLRRHFPELLVIVSPDDFVSEPVVLGPLLVQVHCFHLHSTDSKYIFYIHLIIVESKRSKISHLVTFNSISAGLKQSSHLQA